MWSLHQSGSFGSIAREITETRNYHRDGGKGEDGSEVQHSLQHRLISYFSFWCGPIGCFHDLPDHHLQHSKLHELLTHISTTFLHRKTTLINKKTIKNSYFILVKSEMGGTIGKFLKGNENGRIRILGIEDQVITDVRKCF